MTCVYYYESFDTACIAAIEGGHVPAVGDPVLVDHSPGESSIYQVVAVQSRLYGAAATGYCTKHVVDVLLKKASKAKRGAKP